MSALTEAVLLKLLELPKHLQTTCLALLKLGAADASRVAEATGQSRAYASVRLNQLVTMKKARKERLGKTAFFFLTL